jgi:ABC-type uncharacterized transport system ATPase subunit
MLRLQGICKAFGATQALTDVSLDIAFGSIHGLLGENGAGKTTLMRILFGLERADRGSITLAGVEQHITSAQGARAAGIGMVHQHFALVPNLTALENLVLAQGRGLGGTGSMAIRQKVARLSGELGWTIDCDRKVSELAVGSQQRLEIIKALLGGGRVLILDEPTAPLTPLEATDLFRAVRVLAARGTAVIFISHKLAEVEAVCSEVTILRRGRRVHHGPLKELTRARIAELLVGAQVETPLREGPPSVGEVRLEARHLSVLGRHGEPRVREVGFEVRAGEIVGIAGVDGNGQGELVRALLRLQESTGVISLDGREIPAEAAMPLTLMGVIPEDRRHEGLALGLSITDNLLLKARSRRPFSRHGWLSPSSWRAHAWELVSQFDVRCSSIDQPVAALSGGNQQKVVIARELGPAPKLVIAVNPTRGLDLGATAAVMRRLLDARRAGAGILLVHSDLDELLQIADRVLVMSEGRLAESGWPEASRESIGELMLGAGRAVATGAAPVTGSP